MLMVEISKAEAWLTRDNRVMLYLYVMLPQWHCQREWLPFILHSSILSCTACYHSKHSKFMQAECVAKGSNAPIKWYWASTQTPFWQYLLFWAEKILTFHLQELLLAHAYTGRTLNTILQYLGVKWQWIRPQGTRKHLWQQKDAPMIWNVTHLCTIMCYHEHPDILTNAASCPKANQERGS